MMKLKIHKFIFDNQLQSIFFKDDSFYCNFITYFEADDLYLYFFYLFLD